MPRLLNSNMALSSVKILIKDLVLKMSMGIYDHEKTKPQRVIINIEADIDPNNHYTEDTIETTVSYETLITEITALSQAQHFNLVETFAANIADLCLKDKRISAIKVRVEKPDIIENTGRVGVEIQKSR